MHNVRTGDFVLTGRLSTAAVHCSTPADLDDACASFTTKSADRHANSRQCSLNPQMHVCTRTRITLAHAHLRVLQDGVKRPQGTILE